jgi:AcrR family transcriptional regulator
MMQDAKPRLDRDARREAILDVARDVFLEEGYANASMSTIAARVGGSKGTLYNYFKNKEQLFAAYVVRHCAWQRDAMFELSSDVGDIRAALTQVGRTYLSIVLSDFSMGHLRVFRPQSGFTQSCSAGSFCCRQPQQRTSRPRPARAARGCRRRPARSRSDRR